MNVDTMVEFIQPFVGFLSGAAVFAMVEALGRAIRRHRQARDPLSVDGLAERADVNGCRLVAIAREMDRAARLASDERDDGAAEELRGWSRELKHAALEHLECINAISLDSLAKVESGAVHLGEFKPSRAARRQAATRVAKTLSRWEARRG